MEEIKKGFAICDAQNENSIIYIDDTMLFLYGYENDFSMQKDYEWTLKGLIYEEDYKDVIENLHTLAQSEKSTSVTLLHRIKRKNGVVKNVKCYIQRISSADSDSYSIFMEPAPDRAWHGTVENLSKRKEENDAQRDTLKKESKQPVTQNSQIKERPRKEVNRKLVNKNETNKKKTNKKKRVVLRVAIVTSVLVVLYLIAIYSNNPFISKWRTIYIETAMGTTTHHWMATYFIPHKVIDEVMEKKKLAMEEQKDLASGWENAENLIDADNDFEDNIIVNQSELSEEERLEQERLERAAYVEAFFKKYWELDTEDFREFVSSQNFSKDKPVYMEDLDERNHFKTVNGDPVLVVDDYNNLLIVAVSGEGFVGKMATIKNPEQIELKKTPNLGGSGLLATEYCANYDALVVINASGFVDVDGEGSGGEIRGSLIIDGTEYGNLYNADAHWKFVGMKYDNRLYVSNYPEGQAEDYRMGVQFFPALIVDGENVCDGTLGMGIQPRTAIGQAANGDFMMLVVDGRQIGYSLGCTVEDCANILMDYHACQAINLDGGSSSVMVYDGKQITKSCSVVGNGRLMPDAIIATKVKE